MVDSLLIPNEITPDLCALLLSAITADGYRVIDPDGVEVGSEVLAFMRDVADVAMRLEVTP